MKNRAYDAKVTCSKKPFGRTSVDYNDPANFNSM